MRLVLRQLVLDAMKMAMYRPDFFLTPIDDDR
jgi:hypothetical protein